MVTSSKILGIRDRTKNFDPSQLKIGHIFYLSLSHIPTAPLQIYHHFTRKSTNFSLHEGTSIAITHCRCCCPSLLSVALIRHCCPLLSSITVFCRSLLLLSHIAVIHCWCLLLLPITLKFTCRPSLSCPLLVPVSVVRHWCRLLLHVALALCCHPLLSCPSLVPIAVIHCWCPLMLQPLMQPSSLSLLPPPIAAAFAIAAAVTHPYCWHRHLGCHL